MESTPSEKDNGPRQRILDASLELFVKQGYFNTNVPDISRLSRCSVGSIYHHFLNKEEIAAQLYKDGIELFREALSKDFDSSAELRTIVKSVVVAFLKFSEEHSLLARYIWLARHSEFLSKKILRPTVVGFDRLGRILTHAIKRGIRSGEIAPYKAEIIWSIVFGIPLSFMTDWLDNYTKQTPSEVADVIADAVWQALQVPKK